MAGKRVRRVLLMSSALMAVGAPMTAYAQQGASEDRRPGAENTDRVIVTATRREQTLNDVPLSVAAFQRNRMDTQGVRAIDDIARLTPGVTFSRNDPRNAGSSDIAIRGISSGVGASTTGIYIDDTPIQTRTIGAGQSNFNTYPSIFDLERVEVLRGPQGTLFGAGSQGGTIRFITPQPDFEEYNVYARGEAGVIEGGGENYEAGLAVGGPLGDRVAFRISGWQRRDGGYIDRVNTDPLPGETPLAVFDADPTTPPTILPRRSAVSYVVNENANSQDSRVANAAIALRATESLIITGSLYYQRLENNDSNVYWERLSNPDDNDYKSGVPLAQTSRDEFFLPALKIDWDLGGVRLVSNTSYFDREQSAVNDYTLFESALWAGFWEFPVGMFAPTTQINNQESFTQEVRLESSSFGDRLEWTVGVFYQQTDQLSKQFVENRFLPDLFHDVQGVPFAVAFGQGLASGRYTFAQDPVLGTDEQIAVFGQADLRLTDALTLTAGLRYGETKFEAEAHYEGPVVGLPVNDAGSQTEYPLTPKLGLQYDLTDDNMVYVSASKGFRVGGYNPQVGLPCIAQLATLGYTPFAGNPTGRPVTFQSDTLWSYEVGSKNAVLGGRGTLNASAYYIDWSDIQQGINLQCGFPFTVNAGSVVSKGFDLEGSFMLTDGLTLGMAVGYNHAEYQETVFGGPGAAVPLVSEGDRVAGSPWSVALSGQYSFELIERPAFFRLDYEFKSEGPDDTPGLNTANRSPVLPPLDPLVARPSPETHTLQARLGMEVGNATVSVFVKNLLNENPNLGRGDSALRPVPFGPDQHNYTGYTLTPRTFGATVVYSW